MVSGEGSMLDAGVRFDTVLPKIVQLFKIFNQE